MTKVPVYNQKGEKVSEVEVSSEVFGIEADVVQLEQAVRTYLSSKRDSIASTKTRAEVRGGGRKPWKQKGTGRARHGSIRSPLWSGGGVAFGPRPNRNWSLKMNKKAVRKSLFMALSDKVLAGHLLVIENFQLEDSKSAALLKIIKELLARANLVLRNVLFIISDDSTDLMRAGSNLKQVKFVTISRLNTYEVLRADALIFTKSALDKVESTFKSN